MNEPVTAVSPDAPRSIGSQIVPLRRNWGWLVAAGMALIVLGCVGLVATFTFGLVSTFSFGFMMLAGGGLLLVDAFRHDGWKGRIWSGLIGTLYVVTGLMVFANPVSALITLTLFIAIAMLVAGLFRVVMALQIRPVRAWVILLISGVLSFSLGGLILSQWPDSSRWVLGTFLSIELIFHGWASLALARAIRSTFDGVKPRTS
jgi:uncharacterized membrane protein HdeD (DUF308 family)